jgi:hypothetical protein
MNVYELMDNPNSKLYSQKDWDRVVAVIALGASWQFKDWPGPIYNNPLRLFGSVYGFYIGMEVRHKTTPNYTLL